MKGAKWADLRRIGKQKDNIGPCLARAIPCHTMPYHAMVVEEDASVYSFWTDIAALVVDAKEKASIQRNFPCLLLSQLFVGEWKTDLRMSRMAFRIANGPTIFSWTASDKLYWDVLKNSMFPCSSSHQCDSIGSLFPEKFAHTRRIRRSPSLSWIQYFYKMFCDDLIQCTNGNWGPNKSPEGLSAKKCKGLNFVFVQWKAIKSCKILEVKAEEVLKTRSSAGSLLIWFAKTWILVWHQVAAVQAGAGIWRQFLQACESQRNAQILSFSNFGQIDNCYGTSCTGCIHQSCTFTLQCPANLWRPAEDIYEGLLGSEGSQRSGISAQVASSVAFSFQVASYRHAESYIMT